MAKEEAPSKRYEYKTIKLPIRGEASDKWGKILSEEGAQGWRLIDHFIMTEFLGAHELGLLERELPAQKG